MKPLLLTIVVWLSGFSATSQAAVWENRRSWDDWWEQRFSEWVEMSFREDMFTSGRFAGMAHDCADAVYFSRLIFAHDNGLPFVIKNPLTLSRDDPRADFLSSQTDSFDHLPREKRLRKFMEFIADQVWTKSLINDTYPVAVNEKYFRPGVIAVLPRGEVFAHTGIDLFSYETTNRSTTAGHAQIIKRIDQQGVIHYIKSSQPARIANMQTTTLNSFTPHEKGGSFRYWKQPHDYHKDQKELPGFSTEQFHLDGLIEDIVQQRFAMTPESLADRQARYAQEVCRQIQERIPVINAADKYRKSIGDRCMNFEEYDNYSTPLRDKKIAMTLQYLLKTLDSQDNSLTLLSRKLNDACGNIKISDSLSISAGYFSRLLLQDNWLSDPNQPLAARWGARLAEPNDCQQFY